MGERRIDHNAESDLPVVGGQSYSLHSDHDPPIPTSTWSRCRF